MRWLRHPLPHFLLGGALLFAVAGAPRGTPAADPLVISAADVARLRARYTRETGLPATAADEAALIERTLEEELLFREALARGLDRHDRSVRTWLIEQARVLSRDAADTDDVLYARALALGLDRSDLVVRRILVHKMRLLVARGDEDAVSDTTLRAYHARHADAYRLPARLDLRHVFFAAQRRGEPAAAAAERLLTHLRAAPAPNGAALGGDPHPRPPRLAGQSRRQLEALFGAAAAAAIAAAPARTWVGPLASPHGLHLVWIERREAGTEARFENVRGQVREAWRAEQRAVRLATMLAALRARQPLRIESAAWRARESA